MDLKALIKETDEALISRALIVGLAKLGALAARTPKALDAINEVVEMTDFRDELPESFGLAVDEGLIRVDADWSNGRHETLSRLFSSQSIAAALGSKGGSVKSAAKSEAAKARNAARKAEGKPQGGRPKKDYVAFKANQAEDLGLLLWPDDEDGAVGRDGVYRWTQGDWILVHGYQFPAHKGGAKHIVCDATSFSQAVNLLEAAD